MDEVSWDEYRDQIVTISVTVEIGVTQCNVVCIFLHFNSSFTCTIWEFSHSLALQLFYYVVLTVHDWESL